MIIALSAIFQVSLGLQLDPPADFSCNVIAGQAVSIVKGEAPKSFDEAIARPVDARSGDCSYKHGNLKIDSAQCCCPFWPHDADRLKPLSSLMSLPNEHRDTINLMSLQARYDASMHGCVASFPFHAMNAPPHSFDAAGERIFGKTPEDEEVGQKRVAVVVSGSLSDHTELLSDSFHNIETDIVNPLRRNGASVDVFYHIGYRTDGDIPSELPPWVKGLVLEAPYRGTYAIRSCTDNLVDTMFKQMKRRNPAGRDEAYKTMGPMQRHIFLAYRMAYAYAQETNRDYQYVVRTRPDTKFNSAIDWLHVEQRLTEVPLLIGAQTWLFNARKSGVAVPHRCVVDDQFAVGTMDAVGAYSTVLPDLQDFVRFVQFSRPDLNGHTNERLLTAHLHYRGVNFTDIPLDWSLHATQSHAARHHHHHH